MESTKGKISFREWLKWYVGTLLLAGVGGIVALALDLDPIRSAFAYCAVLFVAAALNRPSGLFRMIRNTRWFADIGSDRVMRGLLTVLAVAMLAAAMLLPSKPR